MSTLENEQIEEDLVEDQEEDQTTSMFEVSDKPSRSTDGVATKITKTLCLGVIERLSAKNEDGSYVIPNGKELRISGEPRNTYGSAAGFGYQIKKKIQETYGAELAAAGINGGVKSGARPRLIEDENGDLVPDKDQKEDEGPWFAAISRG